MQILYSVLSFIVAIGFLVTIHEFGHYWVARRLGVKVLRFSIGFGRALWSRRWGSDGVEYVIAAVPLGGYVKMLDESEGEVPAHEVHRAFNRQPLGVRFAVVAAGPAFNFLFAILACWAMFLIGVSGLKPVVGDIEPGSLAAGTGIEPGYEIVSVDDRLTPRWESVIQAIIGKTLDQDTVRIRTRAQDGVESVLEVDLRGVIVDDLTQGQFFETLGMSPRPPEVPAVIGNLSPGEPAQLGGLESGDRVLAVDGREISGWSALVETVQASPGTPLEFALERAGARVAVTITPRRKSDGDRPVGFIGASPPAELVQRYYVTESYPPAAAFGEALAKSWELTALTLKMVWKMVQLEVSPENLSGPISIAQYAGISAQIGIARFLEFLAIVSISLGILNLLPIPLLDGGHLLYYCVEFFTGRPVSEQVQFIGQRLGIAMLIGLMGLAFFNDFKRLFDSAGIFG